MRRSACANAAPFSFAPQSPTTSMQDHINEFTRLPADIEYDSPPRTKPLLNSQTKLAFLGSLDERREIFQRALGDRVYIMNPGELVARVYIDITEGRDMSSAAEKLQDGAKTLSLRI